MEKTVAFLFAIVAGIAQIVSGDASNPTCGSPPNINGAVTPHLNTQEPWIGAAIIYNCPPGYVSSQIADQISVCTLNPQTGRAEWTVPAIKCNYSPSPQTSNTSPSGECFCTYEYEDQFVIAHIEQKELKVGDTIKRGEIVTFECTVEGKVLSWQNGFRLLDKANMVCDTCKKFQRNDVPVCSSMEDSDTVMSFGSANVILPGGITSVQRGERNRFFCLTKNKYPEWDYGQRNDVSSKISPVPRLYIYSVSTLIIEEEENEPNGVYECYVKDSNGQRLSSTFLHLQVSEADLICPPLDEGIFNLHYSDDRKINSVVTFHCKDGSKKIKGSSSLNCLPDGRWSGQIPGCVDVTCEKPLAPSFGSVVLNGDLKVGTLAAYSCDSGRKLYGADTSRCLISGKWSSYPPECIRSCKVPIIENGEMGRYETRYTRSGSYDEFKKVSEGEYIDSNQTLFLRCNDGAAAVQNSEFVDSQSLGVTCSDGMWSKDIQCNKKPCHTSSLTYPGLIKPEEEYFDSFDSFQINCETGYKMTGRNQNITCVRGEWEISYNPCIPEPCHTSSLTYPGLIKPEEEYFDSFDSFQINCETGYKMTGRNQNITCVRGKWEISYNPCIPEPCHTSSLTYPGLIKPEEEYFDSFDSFQINCETGYKMTGRNQNITCVRGEWEISYNPCIPEPCHTSSLTYPGLIKPEEEYFDSFDSFQINCETGYKMTGRNQNITCVRGEWEISYNPCIPEPCHTSSLTYPGLIKPEEEYFDSFDSFQINCETGYKMTGRNQNITCVRGEWEISYNPCIPEPCHTSSLTYPGLMKPEEEYFDSFDSFQINCETGYKMTGRNQNITCVRGEWEISYNPCIPAHCLGQPPPSKNARPVIQNREHGFQIYYMCIRTYNLKIPGNVTCHLGSWIGIPPRCFNQPCRTSTLTYTGLIKPEEEYFDSFDSFNIYCEIGYTKTRRNQNITCVRGEWEISYNPCIPETEESSIIATTEQTQFRHGEKTVHPSINGEASTPRTTDATRNRECVCTYEFEDSQVKVQTGRKALTRRDTIKLGKTVSIECKSGNKRLKWQNGLVFSGKAYMTCSTCKQWKTEDLPTCTRAISDAFITYDGDFQVLPGGVVNMRMGENGHFTCRSTGGAPVWDFGEREAVRTNTVHVTEESTYVIHLYIIEASEEHKGKYECFLRGDQGTRIGVTVLDLQVHDEEDRSTSTIAPGVTSGVRVTQPSVNVESSSHQTSNAGNNGDCFCTYDYQDQFVNSHIGLKELKAGDAIRRGETVSFGCKFTGMVLTWQNGLVFIGKANMICSTCKKWKRSDVPACRKYESNDAVISFNDDLNVLPGGTAIVQKRERNSFDCIHSFQYPVWNYGTRRGVFVSSSYHIVRGTYYYVSRLDVGPEVNEPNGVYECHVTDTYGRRIGSSFLHIQVNDDVSCPEFPDTSGLSVTYSHNLSVGSIASFECSLTTKHLSGSNSSVCQENGSWSNTLPTCEDLKCSIHDLVMSVPVNLEPDMSDATEEYVDLGFELTLKCSDESVLVGESKAVCEKQGVWKLGNFQCVFGCTLNQDPSSHLLIEPKKDFYRFGEIISLSCPPGEQISNEVEKLMCFTKKWSHSLPECVPL